MLQNIASCPFLPWQPWQPWCSHKAGHARWANHAWEARRPWFACIPFGSLVASAWCWSPCGKVGRRRSSCTSGISRAAPTAQDAPVRGSQGPRTQHPWLPLTWLSHVTLLPWPPITARGSRGAILAIRCLTHSVLQQGHAQHCCQGAGCQQESGLHPAC